MAWKLTVDEFTLRESDLTIGDAERLETETNTTWRFINPVRSAAHAKAILKLALEKAGLSIEDAHAKADGMKVDDYFGLLSEEEEDLPAVYQDGFPQTADGPSTPT